MQLINFDAQFEAYMASWVKENGATYGNNVDRMEERMPEVYLQWLNQPADWLEGSTPGDYFSRFGDAGMLAKWMCAYMEKSIPTPDQLLERITALGAPAEAALLSLLEDEAAPEEARLTAITLLSEMESLAPMALYIRWIESRAVRDDRADLAAEALEAMGRQVVAPALAAAKTASEQGRETLLDVLCNFPGEEAIFDLALSMFHARRARRALHASLLGKLGDARAIEPLRKALDDPDLPYLDYIELRNALEACGGDAPPERAFDGDPYYESLKRME